MPKGIKCSAIVKISIPCFGLQWRSFRSVLHLMYYFWLHLMLIYLCISFSVLDSYARRLEHSVVSWYAKDKSLGSPLFCGLDDLWKLRTVQSPSGHFGGRVFQSSKAFHNHLHCFTHSFIITNIKSLKFVYCSKLNIFTHYHHRQSLFYFHSLLLCTYYCC